MDNETERLLSVMLPSQAHSQPPQFPADRLYPQRQDFASREEDDDPLSSSRVIPEDLHYSRWSGKKDDATIGTGADIIRGGWTCCRKLGRDAPPCYQTRQRNHSADLAKCKKCGMFYSLALDEKSRKMGVPNCSFHPEEPVNFTSTHSGQRRNHPFGTSIWPCCNAAGFANTKYHFYNKTERQALHVSQTQGLMCEQLEDSLNVRDSWGCTQGYHEPTWTPFIACRCETDSKSSKQPSGGSESPDDRRCTMCGRFWGVDCNFHPGTFCPTIRFRLVRDKWLIPSDDQIMVHNFESSKAGGSYGNVSRRGNSPKWAKEHTSYQQHA